MTARRGRKRKSTNRGSDHARYKADWRKWLKKVKKQETILGKYTRSTKYVRYVKKPETILGKLQENKKLKITNPLKVKQKQLKRKISGIKRILSFSEEKCKSNQELRRKKHFINKNKGGTRSNDNKSHRC